MPKYGLIACFSPVSKVNFGKHKSDSTGSQKLRVEKWKNKWGFANPKAS